MPAAAEHVDALRLILARQTHYRGVGWLVKALTALPRKWRVYPDQLAALQALHYMRGEGEVLCLAHHGWRAVPAGVQGKLKLAGGAG